MKIEKGIPVPTLRGNSKYPFAEMEVGDSFLTQAKLSAVCTMAKRYKHDHEGVDFTCKQVDGGVRCWRIK